jgi:G:T-mismatch repair DNA endonuclease (very short patch repair protein)
MPHDKQNYKQLKEQGKPIVVAWACKLEKTESRDNTLVKLVRALTCSVGQAIEVGNENR